MKRKIWKIGGFLLGGVLLLLFLAAWFLHEPKPQGEAGAEAEALAEKMLEAINYPAWDSTDYVSWTFNGTNHYLWDRERHWVEVTWKDHRVLLRIDERSGKAWKEGILLGEKKTEKLLQQAWKMWVNDSFWMSAPAKIRDPGTQRFLVEGEGGKKGLMVSFSQGGNTPGDSYLWHLDEQGLPQAWEMWVGIIPVGGIDVSWEGWKTLATGAKVSEIHKIGNLVLEVSDIQGASQIEELIGGNNPFSDL